MMVLFLWFSFILTSTLFPNCRLPSGPSRSTGWLAVPLCTLLCLTGFANAMVVVMRNVLSSDAPYMGAAARRDSRVWGSAGQGSRHRWKGASECSRLTALVAEGHCLTKKEWYWAFVLPFILNCFFSWVKWWKRAYYFFAYGKSRHNENGATELRGSPLPKGIARGRLAHVCENVLGWRYAGSAYERVANYLELPNNSTAFCRKISCFPALRIHLYNIKRIAVVDYISLISSISDWLKFVQR